MFISDTIAAISTGMNNSGIGIIRISGPDSFNIACKIFRNSKLKSYDTFESHKIYYGYIFDEKIIDEVLLLPFKAPKSFTMEDTVEIDCHGGNLVMKKILNLIIKNGARLAEPGEFTKRAFLNGRIDLSKAEAVIDVINANNDLYLDNSIKQLTGKLNDKVRDIRNIIKYQIAYIESALDDPEHIDITGYYDTLLPIINEQIEVINKLIKSYDSGKIISEGIKTVILGKPNVGKSSLLNNLYGSERAIVTDIAGTTRDIIEEKILINGIPLNIIDTAGIRNTDDIVEKIGVDKALEIADNADLILLMLDSSNKIDNQDIKLLNYIEDKNSIILLNKCDLKSVIGIDDIKKYSDKFIYNISVKDEFGIDEFKNKINEMFLSGTIKYNDELIITNERYKILLERTLNSLNEVINSIELDMPEDFISIDLLSAYETLGNIIGEKIDDDIVNEIFSKFCTGK